MARILIDKIDHVDTVAVGVWIPVGTRMEVAANNGISHFLEHMAFKGTTSRTAFDIAQQMEAVGGDLNAYTSREVTAYYARVMAEDTPLALDILSDILQNSTFDASECERERGVILQEIGQSEDTPDDIVQDHFQRACYGDTSMGWPVLGPAHNVQALTTDQLACFMHERYDFNQAVVSLAGHSQALENARDSLPSLFEARSIVQHKIEPSRYLGGEVRTERPLEQVNMIVGFEGFHANHVDRDALSLWAGILGGGMASRLFQEVREKRGLVYGIHCVHQSYTDSGVLSVEAGTDPAALQELIKVIADVLCCSVDTITEEELRRAKKQASAGLMMSRESLFSRCEQQANQMLVYGKTYTPHDILKRIQAVTLADIQRAARTALNTPLSMAAIGPLDHLPCYDDVRAQFNV